MPRTTFAIPCRNGADYLPELLQSLASQTCQDFDLLLVDDASADGSAELARKIMGGRVRVVRNAEPLGLIPNFNRCAELVDTELFCIAHADDVYAPTYLARLTAALDSEPSAALAHCVARTLTDDGSVWDAPAERFKRRFWRRLPAKDAAEQFRLLLAGNHVVCPSALFRTSVYRDAGGFLASLRYAADWELWLRMSLKGHLFAAVDEPLFAYRRHDCSATSEASRTLVRYREELDVLRWAGRAGQDAGILHGQPPLRALRNTVLQDVVDDVSAGRRSEACEKLGFLRDEAPGVWRSPAVVAVRSLLRCGATGRAALRIGRALAMRVIPLA